MTIRYLTWSNPNELHRLGPLQASAAKWGIELKPIACYSLLDKLWSLGKELESYTKNTLVVCSDGYDCLYIQSRNDIRAILEQSNSKIIFSAQAENDHHTRPVADFFRRRYPGAPYPILNSGVIAGRSASIIKLIKQISGWNLAAEERDFRANMAGIGTFNDQTLCGIYATRFPDEIAVDSEAKLSWTSAYENELVDTLIDREAVSFLNPISGFVPCIFHLPNTSPGVYVQYLRAFTALGGDVIPSKSNILLIESFLSHPGRLANDAAKVLSLLRKHSEFSHCRRKQIREQRIKRAKIAISKLIRLWFHQGTGIAKR
jgi:hypothetical protein